MSLTYVRSESWKSKSRDRALKKIYSLVYKLYNNNILIVGASSEEIEIAEKEGLKDIEITQPDLEEAKKIKETYGVNVLLCFLYEIPREKRYKVIICLNVIDWEPIKPKEAFKRIYEILDDNGYLIISFYSRILENAPDKDFIHQTREKILLKKEIKKCSPKKFLIVGNGESYYFKFPIRYRDKNGILEAYLLTKEDVKLIYERVFRNR